MTSPVVRRHALRTYRSVNRGKTDLSGEGLIIVQRAPHTPAAPVINSYHSSIETPEVRNVEEPEPHASLASPDACGLVASVLAVVERGADAAVAEVAEAVA